MKVVTYLAIALLTPLSFANADAHDVFGLFATEDGGSHISIEDCGDGSPCGTVAWIDPAEIENGMAPEDLTTKSGKKVLGLLMLEGFSRKRSDWRGGTIYSPEADRTYASRLKRRDDGSLQVKGCVGPICQTQIWTAINASDE
ncbi:MAG: hypothetical protein Hens2KO_09830 [Henriciella sp.]